MNPLLSIFSHFDFLPFLQQTGLYRTLTHKISTPDPILGHAENERGAEHSLQLNVVNMLRQSDCVATVRVPGVTISHLQALKRVR